MGYTTRRRVDTTHPLAKFYRLLNYERQIVLRALERDRDALSVFDGRMLEWVRLRQKEIYWAKYHNEQNGTSTRWPRGLTKRDEKRYLHWKRLSDTHWMKAGRTDRILMHLRGERGGEPPRLRAYAVALDECRRDGTAAALAPLLLDAHRKHEAFLEAARVAAESGHSDTGCTYRDAESAVCELFDHLPPAKDEPPADPEDTDDDPDDLDRLCSKCWEAYRVTRPKAERREVVNFAGKRPEFLPLIETHRMTADEIYAAHRRYEAKIRRRKNRSAAN